MSEVKDIDVEKVLMWAGFDFIDKLDEEFWLFKPHSSNTNIEMYGARWISPDGEGTYIHPPDIRNSMDACMEWLEPVLFAKGYRYMLVHLKDGRHLARLLGITYTEAISDTPAIAFSKAVDKLIDWEKEQNENTRQA